MKEQRPPRQPLPEQDPAKRRHNFQEVPFGYDEETAVLEASRCLGCKKPKCVDGCPVEIDIPGFVGLVRERKFKEAMTVIRATNNLPAICGRVCPQETQCEELCVLGKAKKSGPPGEPVAVGRLERFLADYEREKLKWVVPHAVKTGKRVAVSRR